MMAMVAHMVSMVVMSSVGNLVAVSTIGNSIAMNIPVGSFTRTPTQAFPPSRGLSPARLPHGTFAELRRSAWCAVNFGGCPIWTPRALARARPSPVLALIGSRSNSAKPPSTVSIKRPCAVVVSAHASANDLNVAPALLMASRMLRRSRVPRASLSSPSQRRHRLRRRSHHYASLCAPPAGFPAPRATQKYCTVTS
jgi:hypothetical protein